MIKSKNGETVIYGDIPEILSDIVCTSRKNKK